jgi:uncharacterized repeat protein (TIGR01451 family)
MRLMLLALLGLTSAPTLAAPSLRVSVVQHGDFLLIGNTLGYDCWGALAPLVGVVSPDACAQLSPEMTDSAPDVFWVSDAPSPGQALASISNTAAQARSTAILELPVGASVTHAYLYWAAINSTGTPDPEVTLERTGSGGFSQTITASQLFGPSVNNAYQSVADVTSLVQQYGSGPYRVGGIDVLQVTNLINSNVFGAWALVVLYERSSDSLRTLSLFDGLDAVSSGNNQAATLTDFLVPSSGISGKLGVIAYEGDATITGDSLLFNGSSLSDAMNPVSNFFNGTRSFLGAPVSVIGDLPQLSGAALSMAGVDLDVVDVTAHLSPGQTSATIVASSSGDIYYLGALISSIATFRPDFSTSTKQATDVNGGALLAGDVLKYTLALHNTGNDPSTATRVDDPLPAGIDFVPGSLRLADVAKTDAAGDDECEYAVDTRTVSCRVGAGATASSGGQVPIGGTVTVTFEVAIAPGFTGNLSNQATITAPGLSGAPSTSTPTDGNGAGSGAPATTVLVDGCASKLDCAAITPVCDTSSSPKVCVGCLVDSDCGQGASGQVCSAKTCVAGCRGAGGNGCPAGHVCTSADSTQGQCVECLADSDCGGSASGKVCEPATSQCVAGCRGTGGNACLPPTTCTSADSSIGVCVQCTQDAQCGGSSSGAICESQRCVDGCRGAAGNACPTGKLCTSTASEPGHCVECFSDSDCGGTMSGRVCDDGAQRCIDGCREHGGNGCPGATVCDSSSQAIGTCTPAQVDAGLADAGAADADAGVDAGSSQAVDAGSVDAGVADEGVDAGPSQAVDAGSVDAGVADEGVDAGPSQLADAGPVNPGGADAGTDSDADAGEPVATAPGGCGCTSGASTPTMLWISLACLGLLFRTRRQTGRR